MTSTRVAVLAVLVAIPLAARADEQSEQAASRLLRAKLANESPRDAALLAATRGKDIVVVAGSMDHIETVLASAHIPFTMIQPEQVAGWPLRNDQIVMVNCPGVMPDAGVAHIERFVRAGGLLYSTDWALENVVQKAFPGTIAHRGGSSGDEVVPVVVDALSDNLMSRMLLTAKGEPQWWLEGGSYSITILNPRRVDVLAHSNTMKTRYGAAPVVVRFRWEDGEVIHVVSHFVRQMATTGPQVAAAAKVGEVSGLTPADKAGFAQAPEARANFGDVESSYAFQKMTANLVVAKQRKNAELDRAYGMTVAAPAVTSVGRVQAGIKLKVLSRSAGQATVRDDSGNEFRVDEKALRCEASTLAPQELIETPGQSSFLLRDRACATETLRGFASGHAAMTFAYAAQASATS